MIEIHRILCPIDFSEFSRRALDYAVAIARWYESSVTVLHVFSAAPVAAYAPGAPGFQSIVLTQSDRDELLAGVRRFAGEASAPGISIEAAIREGDAVAEILQQAADMQAELIVMGTHGRSGFERLLLGSITEKVLRKAPCPVLTVPRQQPDAVPATAVMFKRIVCPVDLSESSMRALEYAMSLAQENDAQLTLLHVLPGDSLELPEFPEMQTLAGRDRDAALAARQEEFVRNRLREAVPASVAEYCEVDVVVARGKPGREIIRVAGEKAAELIVIGVEGRGTAGLALFGSTTQHVVRNAACPVLSLRR